MAKQEQANTSQRSADDVAEVLYSESQPVPFGWWLAAAGVVGLVAFQARMQRVEWVGYLIVVVIALVAIWALWKLSGTKIEVVRHHNGEIWLHTHDAQLPASVVSRSLVIPPTAKQAAMGRQLDPAAYVVHHNWIPTMAMFVLDDPNDPTPYWLISSKEPQQLVEALGRPIY